LPRPLKAGLGIDNADIGVLAAVVSAIGLLTTVPAGALTDRISRTRLSGSRSCSPRPR